MSKPIVIRCKRQLPFSSQQIRQQLLQVENWSDFKGHGPLPGIQSATFENQTPHVLGSRIRVNNTDGSSHCEEIVRWEPHAVRLRFQDFSPPLSHLASHFLEDWLLTPQTDNQTLVERSMLLYPKHLAGKLLLWLISHGLRQALDKHLLQLANSEKKPA